MGGRRIKDITGATLYYGDKVVYAHSTRSGSIEFHQYVIKGFTPKRLVVFPQQSMGRKRLYINPNNCVKVKEFSELNTIRDGFILRDARGNYSDKIYTSEKEAKHDALRDEEQLIYKKKIIPDEVLKVALVEVGKDENS